MPKGKTTSTKEHVNTPKELGVGIFFTNYRTGVTNIQIAYRKYDL